MQSPGLSEVIRATYFFFKKKADSLLIFTCVGCKNSRAVLLSCKVANGFHHVGSKRGKPKRHVSPNVIDLTTECFRLGDNSHSSLQWVVFGRKLPQKDRRCCAELSPERKMQLEGLS